MDLISRLNSVIQKDKENNPKYIMEVIKSDIFYLLNNYFEVAFEDVVLDIKVENDFYKINIDAKGNRIKMFNALPE